MAMNWRVVPFAMLGLIGEMAKDTSVAGVTVSVVAPDTMPDIAVIVVEPVATEVPSPIESAALLMVAIFVLDELQVTTVVRF